MVEVRIFEKSLRWNAPPIKARSASALHFDTGHLFSKLTGPDGCDISAWATTDNDKIVGHAVTVDTEIKKSRLNGLGFLRSLA
jgi:hypothetical protein